MPRLNTVLACEKVIVDRNGPVSLIGIFQKVNVPTLGEKFPANAVSPFRWAVFALWIKSPEEINNKAEFTQKTEIFRADGTLFSSSLIRSVTMSVEDPQYKMYVDVVGIPVETEGNIRVRVSLVEDPEEFREYFFPVVYTVTQPDQSD